MTVVYLPINKIWPAHEALIEVPVHDIIPGGREKDHEEGSSLYGSAPGDGVPPYVTAATPGEKLDDKVAQEEGRYL